MEEEPKVNFISKALVWIKSHIAITVAIAVALIVVIVLICVFAGGGPKSAVKKFVKGMSTANISKIEKSVDFVGIEVWGYNDPDDFSESDYDDFVSDYEDAKDEIDEDEIKDNLDSLEEMLKDQKDEYKKYEMKVEEFKDVEKLGKDLYVVKAKISIKAEPEDEDLDEVDQSSVMPFVVYKDKIISMSIF